MKKIFLFSVLTAAMMLTSCSKLQDEKAPTQPTLSVHAKSFTDTASADFHGKYLQTVNNDLNKCATCHAGDFKGGTTNVSCLTCHNFPHEKGFADSTSSKHHSDYLQANGYMVQDCQKCHGTDFKGKGSSDKSCYTCHTLVHDQSFGTAASPNYHAKYIAANNYDLKTCQTCHGVNFAGNGVAAKTCLTCHSKTNGPENCTTCHGSTNAAPPNDLAGNSSSSFRGVGAHQKHLTDGLLSKAMACSDCHVVPQTLYAAGHLDTSANAEVRFDPASALYRSTASYSAATVSCSNTYCHSNFPGGNAANVVQWNDATSSAAACGTCHGDATKTTLKEKAFPKTGHNFVAVTSDCASCHAEVINASLTIIDPSRHINGKIN